jgi:hypothetical protein
MSEKREIPAPKGPTMEEEIAHQYITDLIKTHSPERE